MMLLYTTNARRFRSLLEAEREAALKKSNTHVSHISCRETSHNIIEGAPYIVLT